MAGFADLLTTKLVSYLLQACEEMALPGGSAPGGEASEVTSSVLQAGLPAAGEVLPLTAALAVFLIAGALILRRRGSTDEREAAEPAESAQAEEAWQNWRPSVHPGH